MIFASPGVGKECVGGVEETDTIRDDGGEMGIKRPGAGEKTMEGAHVRGDEERKRAEER